MTLFDEFWSAYPRKVGKGAARKKYALALKKTTHDEIMFGLSQQRASMEAKETKFIPHASTWLNQERWDDEPEPDTSTDTNANAASFAVHVAARTIRTPGGDCF